MEDWVDEGIELLNDMEYRREQAEEASRQPWGNAEEDAELEAWDESIDTWEATRGEPEAWEIEQDRQQAILFTEQGLEREAYIAAAHERLRQAATGEASSGQSTYSGPVMRVKAKDGPTPEPGPEEGPEAYEAWRKKRIQEQLAACGEYWD